MTVERADFEALQTPPGRKRLQMPMVSLTLPAWKTLIGKRISQELERRTVADASRRKADRLGRTAIREIMSALLPDPEKLLADALGIHIDWYGQVANAEADFDLGLKPHHVILGEPDGYAVVFATIDPDACARLQKFRGVRKTWRRLTSERSKRYESLGITSTEFDEEEAIMDLLVSALPYTTHTIGMSTPSVILDRAIDERLKQFEVLATLRDRARESRSAPVNRSFHARPARPKKTH